MSESAVNPLASITHGMLAGGGECKGLPKYATPLSRQINQVTGSITKESSNCKCSAVVLALLALLAAGAAGTLIAFSGGPSNLQLFVPGAVLGGFSVGMVVWLVVLIVKSMRYKQEQKGTATDLSGKVIKPETVLEGMRAEATTKKHIEVALGSFSSEQRQAYMQHVNDTIFGEEYAEVLPEDKKILKAFASYPADVNKLNFETIHRDFALEILANTKSTLIKKKGAPAFFNKLITKTGVPKNEEEGKIFAQHPLLLAHLAQNDEKFTGEVARDVLTLMNEANIAVFLKKMADDLAKLKMQHSEANDTTGAQNQISGVIGRCINVVFTEALVKSYSSEAEGVPSKAVSDLLAQIARWPEEIVSPIYLSHKDLDLNPVLLNSLYEAMTEEQQKLMVDHFVTTATEVSRSEHDEKKTKQKNGDWIFRMLKAYGGVKLPEPTVQIFTKLPHAWAVATKGTLGKLDPSTEGNVNLVNSKFVNTEVGKKEEYNEESKIQDMLRFREGPTAYLKDLAAHKDKIKDSAAVEYFKEHPDQFKEFVLDNEMISREPKVRHFLALDILEHMGEATETVIFSMEKGSWGYSTFAALYGRLFNEIKGVEDTTTVSVTRAQLIARFTYGSIDRALRKPIPISDISEVREIRISDTITSNKFDKIALTQKDNVWKK